jgi:hypothetical protein
MPICRAARQQRLVTRCFRGLVAHFRTMQRMGQLIKVNGPCNRKVADFRMWHALQKRQASLARNAYRAWRTVFARWHTLHRNEVCPGWLLRLQNLPSRAQN